MSNKDYSSIDLNNWQMVVKGSSPKHCKQPAENVQMTKKTTSFYRRQLRIDLWKITCFHSSNWVWKKVEKVSRACCTISASSYFCSTSSYAVFYVALIHERSSIIPQRSCASLLGISHDLFMFFKFCLKISPPIF